MNEIKPLGSPSPSIRPARTDAPVAPVPERAPAPAALSEMSSRDLAALGGASSFEPVRANATAALTPAAIDAINVIGPVTRGVTAATERLEAANGEVAKAEGALARELAHLSSALEPAQLGAYAADSRAEHQDTYDEANAAAHGLTAALRDTLPAAITASASPGFEVGMAATLLEAEVDRGMQALDTYVRQSPTADTALVAELAQTGSRLGTVALVGEQTLGIYASTGGRFAELANQAGAAFGLVGAAADAYGSVARVSEGGARAEQYVGAAAGITQVGLGVLSIAGVTVSAPLSATVAVIATGSAAVSGIRDAQEQQAAVQQRLTGLGYGEATAAGLAQAQPAALAALRAEGFEPAALQALAEASPRLLGQSPDFLDAFSEVRRTAELTPDRTVEFLRAMGPSADDVAGVLVMNRVRLGTATRPELLEALRPANPAFAVEGGARAAEWLEAQG
jgi:uncharacterized protein YukE